MSVKIHTFLCTHRKPVSAGERAPVTTKRFRHEIRSAIVCLIRTSILHPLLNFRIVLCDRNSCNQGNHNFSQTPSSTCIRMERLFFCEETNSQPGRTKRPWLGPIPAGGVRFLRDTSPAQYNMYRAQTKPESMVLPTETPNWVRHR